MNLLVQYKIAKETTYRINTEKVSLEKSTDQDLHNILTEYSSKISQLEQERDAKLCNITKSKETKHETLTENALESNKTIYTVKNILSMIDLIKSSPKIKTPFVYYFSDRDDKGNYTSNKRKVPIEPIKTLIKDKNNLLSLYIVPNGKPVNKFSLILRGDSIFSKYLDSCLFIGYIHKIHEENCPVKLVIKEDPTQSTLIEYANNPKNLPKILAMLPQNLSQLEKEYEEAVILLQDKEWQIAYLTDKMEYYENAYSQGTKTPEYAALKKQLKKLL